MDSNKIALKDHLKFTVDRIKALAYLMISHDPDAGIPSGLNPWYHVGSILEELSEEVEKTGQKL